MKLNKITIQNFIGAQGLEVHLHKPVQLFCGANGAGKSSIAEAVRMALTGETVRVDLKKDYAQLVSDGEESGFAEVVADAGTYSMVLPSGKGSHVAECAALPYVLDPQRFAKMSPADRRDFLFGLMRLATDGHAVKQRMIQKGCNAKMVDTIAPMLRAGFDAAHKEAQAKARDEKAAWRTITGETYGDKKAATWAAEVPTFDGAKLADLEEQLSKVDGELATLNQQLGAQVAAQSKYAEAAGRIDELREKAQKYARIQDKLLKDEDELKTWKGKVEAAKQSANGGRKIGLVHDLAYALNDAISFAMPFGEMNPEVRAKLRNANSAIDQYTAQHGGFDLSEDGSSEEKHKLPEYEKALQLMQNAVANGKRDLAEADAAARAISEVEATIGTAEDKSKEIEAMKLAINTKTGLKTKLAGDINDLARSKNQATQAEQRTAKALTAHEAVSAWSKIADALSSIPGEMLGEALEPLNNRLMDTAEMTMWSCVFVDSDMGIYYDKRPYGLLSESEQWRVDAMLAEAISHISMLRLISLDRFDLLDIQGREDLIVWMHMLAENNEIDTALLFGTLKAAPTALPPSIQTHWVEKQAEEVLA
jgi:hypothetical protein